MQSSTHRKASILCGCCVTCLSWATGVSARPTSRPPRGSSDRNLFQKWDLFCGNFCCCTFRLTRQATDGFCRSVSPRALCDHPTRQRARRTGVLEYHGHSLSCALWLSRSSYCMGGGENDEDRINTRAISACFSSSHFPSDLNIRCCCLCLSRFFSSPHQAKQLPHTHTHIAVIVRRIRNPQPDVLSPNYRVGISSAASPQIDCGNDVARLHRSSCLDPPGFLTHPNTGSFRGCVQNQLTAAASEEARTGRNPESNP